MNCVQKYNPPGPLHFLNQEHIGVIRAVVPSKTGCFSNQCGQCPVLQDLPELNVAEHEEAILLHLKGFNNSANISTISIVLVASIY